MLTIQIQLFSSLVVEELKEKSKDYSVCTDTKGRFCCCVAQHPWLTAMVILVLPLT